jgi:hypothetical protein
MSNQLKQQMQRYSSNFTPRVHDDEVQVQNQELLDGLQQQQSVWKIPNNYVSSIPVSPGLGVVRPLLYAHQMVSTTTSTGVVPTTTTTQPLINLLKIIRPVPQRAAEAFYNAINELQVPAKQVQTVIVESSEWHRKWIHQDETSQLYTKIDTAGACADDSDLDFVIQQKEQAQLLLP